MKKPNMKGKRGNAAVLSLVGVVLAIVVAGIALVVGSSVINNVQQSGKKFLPDGNQSYDAAWNVSTFTLQGLLNTGSQFGLIGLVAGLGVVMAVLFIYLGGFIPGFGKGGGGRY